MDFVFMGIVDGLAPYLIMQMRNEPKIGTKGIALIAHF